MTDRSEAVVEALQRGDTDAARELTWTTDKGPTLRKIEEALEDRPEKGGPESTRTERRARGPRNDEEISLRRGVCGVV